jgi:hypothetical protein
MCYNCTMTFFDCNNRDSKSHQRKGQGHLPEILQALSLDRSQKINSTLLSLFVWIQQQRSNTIWHPNTTPSRYMALMFNCIWIRRAPFLTYTQITIPVLKYCRTWQSLALKYYLLFCMGVNRRLLLTEKTTDWLFENRAHIKFLARSGYVDWHLYPYFCQTLSLA